MSFSMAKFFFNRTAVSVDNPEFAVISLHWKVHIFSSVKKQLLSPFLCGGRNLRGGFFYNKTNQTETICTTRWISVIWHFGYFLQLLSLKLDWMVSSGQSIYSFLHKQHFFREARGNDPKNCKISLHLSRRLNQILALSHTSLVVFKLFN